MAKVSAEKFKELGIRHGEKVGVAVVSALCLLMFWMAWSRPTIEMSPSEVEQATNSAQSNLNKKQDEEAILAKIEEQGITLPGFETIVDNRKPGSANPSKYSLNNLMVAPEPGAGVLRDRPELIAISQLQAHPGRGAISVLVTDPNTGEVVYVDPNQDAETKKASERRKTRNRNRGAMGGMGMAMGGMGMGMGMGAGGQESEKAKRDREKAQKKQQSELRKGLAGQLPPDRKGGDEPNENARADGTVPKESTRGFRWVAVTGVLDHQRLRENYAKALRVDLAAAHPHYLRVDVERQQRLQDGEWSDWEPVDRSRIETEVLNRLTETDPETNPESNQPILKENATLSALTDPLPFLEVGYWVGVHPVDLVNLSAFEEPKPSTTGTGLAGGGGMMPGGMGPGMMAGGPGGRGRGRGGMMPGGMGPGGASAGPGMGMGMGAFGGMFGNSGGGPVDTNFEKSEAEALLVRFLDFTAEPDAIYRYRARLVVQNPNLGLQNVMPGVDTTTRELTGPFSDPTETVVVPPDVATYVVDYAPEAMDKRRNDLVSFQVVRWDPKTGVTIVKQQTSAPGQVVGEEDNANVPDLDRSRTSRARVDFTSYRVLVDTSGGPRPVDRLDVGANQYDAPAIALMLRPDGTLLLRDESGDAVDGEMQEMVDIYNQTLKDVKAEDKKTSTLPGGMFGGGQPSAGGAR